MKMVLQTVAVMTVLKRGLFQSMDRKDVLGMEIRMIQLIKMGLLQSDGFVDKEDKECSIDKRSLESSHSSDSDKLFENGSLEKLFSDDGSEIDDEVAEEYSEGIGGSFEVVNAEWLLEQALDGSNEDDSSNSSSDDILKEGHSLKCRLQKRIGIQDEDGLIDDEGPFSK
ncbi:hypothetical protein NE237_025665 [Protea cynaroides]|uniref:Uncharacterized protein n=1 Tax=Protea cynaroides TaxID=273540 RepID=A0A9Q0H7H1_9MAGN|nr:hypothetical protein NE237_025665 [Protea cynaroides]